MHDCHHIHLDSVPATTSLPVALPNCGSSIRKAMLKISKKAFFFLESMQKKEAGTLRRLCVNESKGYVFQKDKISPKINFRKARPRWKDTLHYKWTELGRAKLKTFRAWFGLQGSYLLLSHIIKHRSETGSGITEHTELRTSEDTCPINRNHLPIQSNTHMFWQPLSQ